MSGSGMTVDESARRLGGFVWTERRLFELLGGWVPTTADPAVKLALSRASRRCGAHALALMEILPDTRDHDPEALVAPPEGLGPAFLAAGATGDPNARLEHVVGVLAPAHVGMLDGFLADASAVRDGPSGRVVRGVLDEDRAAFEELERLSGR